MPYKIKKNEKGRFCIHKMMGDGEMGDTIECFDSEDKAKEKMKSMMAQEGKNSLRRHRVVEQRTFPLAELRVDQVGDGKAARIKGHAAVFDQRSVPLLEFEGMRFVEVIEPGAFKKTIKEADVRALINHDPNYVLGRNKSGTLALAEDKRGLAVDIQPPDTQYANDLLTSMRRGDVDQMSFGFQAIKEAWEREKDEATGVVTHIRRVKEARLFDVSVVTFPAYPTTDAQVRSLIDACAGSAPEELIQAMERAEPVGGDHSADEEPQRDNEPANSHSERSEQQTQLAQSERPEPIQQLNHSMAYYRTRLEDAEKRLRRGKGHGNQGTSH